jgi:DNA helicase II / ATP-dependent DNA helicase PcrA
MENFKQFYSKLNKAQKEAVDFIDGPLLVLAGPGTGKTELLSIRTANIISKKGISPENILVLTYTNAASKAMKERLVKMLGRSGYDVQTGTFHSFANSVILESDEAVDYIQDKIQISDFEKVKLLEYILDNTDGIDPIRPFRAPYMYRNDIESRISELKKEGITPKLFESHVSKMKPDGIYIEQKHLPRLLALSKVYKLYEEYKTGRNKAILDERGRYDFDDMIVFALDAVRKQPLLKSELKAQYFNIMVDEFQDTNGAQFDLLLEISGTNKPNLCCVGDDDQSIYRFQGASVGNFKLLKKCFPSLKQVSLKENYRSTKEIIGISDKLINSLPQNERMQAKELIPKKDYTDKNIEFHEFSTEAEELAFISKRVEELKGLIEDSSDIPDEDKKNPYNNIAVLARKRDDILKIVDTFLSAGIPYATDGKEDISSEKRVRQMLDIIMLADTSDINLLSEKDTLLYSVLSSDYFNIPLSDILLMIKHVKALRMNNKSNAHGSSVTFFSEFVSAFDFNDLDGVFSEKEASTLEIAKKIEFKRPQSFFKAAWAIMRFIRNAKAKPVHSAILQYIDDAGLYKYILDSYIRNDVLRIRELRCLGSFINMVKESDLSNPAIGLKEFIDIINTRKEHGMPLQGSLVSMSQNGVRIFTAHGSKGLEFHSVLIPFCLQDKNWPIKQRADKIPLPPDIFKAQERARDKLQVRQLSLYDETRLFYVASTRAKSNLIYTASPAQGNISSSYLPFMGLESTQSQSQINEEDVLSQSLKITKKKDPFIGTEAVLSDMISGLSLNPTSLNNYINCKRKFLFNDILRLPSQKKLGLTFGNCVHKALEDTYRHLIENKKFPKFSFFKSAFLKELDFQGPDKAIRSACTRQVDTLKNWFEKEAVNPVMPLALENKLSMLITDDLVFTGKYDKTELVDKKNMLVRVVDYKTGKPDEHVKKILSGNRILSSAECDGYLRQLACYKLLYENDKSSSKTGKVSEGALVFVEPAKTTVIKHGLKKGEFVQLNMQITDEVVSELELVISNCWKSIKALEFNRLPEYDDRVDKCGGCDYKNLCW